MAHRLQKPQQLCPRLGSNHFPAAWLSHCGPFQEPSAIPGLREDETLRAHLSLTPLEASVQMISLISLVEAHLQGSARSWESTGLYWLQPLASQTQSVPCRSPGFGLGVCFAFAAGSSLWEAEELMDGTGCAREQWVSTKAIAPGFFFISLYIFKADLLLVKMLSGQSSRMLCICFIFS